MKIKRKIQILSIVVASLLFLQTAELAAAAPPGGERSHKYWVIGDVINGDTGGDLQGALVKAYLDGVYKGYVYTDSSGHFSYSVLMLYQPGYWTVEVSCDGYDPETKSKAVSLYTTNMGTIALDPIPPPQNPYASVWEPTIDIDVLIAFDYTAISRYEDKGALNPISQMVEDVSAGLSVFTNYFPNMQFHVSTDWMIFDLDGCDPPYDNGADLYRKWPVQLGWPSQTQFPDNGTGEMNHLGMEGTGYSGLHGSRFDLLVMFTGWNPFESAGFGYYGYNVISINMITLNLGIGWSPGIPPLLGTWTAIAHEYGHTKGLQHGFGADDTDIMGDWSKFLQPGCWSLSEDNQAIVRFYQHQHDDRFWDEWTFFGAVDDSWESGADPTSKRWAINDYAIFSPWEMATGYAVDTIGMSELGYWFYAYPVGSKVRSNEDGVISAMGLFRQYDSIAEQDWPNRRYLTVFVLDANTLEIVFQFRVLEYYDGTDWELRRFTIFDLARYTDYILAVGRRDAWIAERDLTAEWSWFATSSYVHS